MTNTPCQLMFKRSQTKGDKPQFTLTAFAEMTPEFERAAHEYGLWNEIIYTDPRVDETRELELEKGDRTVRRRRALGLAFDAMPGFITFIFGPFFLIMWITKLIAFAPFKLLFWWRRANRVQDKQIMRFGELRGGKSFTTTDLIEMVQIEETIKASVAHITTHVGAALNYQGDVAVTPEAA